MQTLDPVCIPGLNHPVKSNLSYLTGQRGHTIPCQVVLHVKHLLICKVGECPFQWVVYPVVDLWPHPFNDMILNMKRVKTKLIPILTITMCDSNH